MDQISICFHKESNMGYLHDNQLINSVLLLKPDFKATMSGRGVSGGVAQFNSALGFRHCYFHFYSDI